MEEKSFLIPQSGENFVLGQESLFGWQLKEKEIIEKQGTKRKPSKENSKKKTLNKNPNNALVRYTLVRDRKDEDVTQYEIDFENKWDEAFKDWFNYINDQVQTYMIALPGMFFAIICGFVLFKIGIGSLDGIDTMGLKESSETLRHIFGGAALLFGGFISWICTRSIIFSKINQKIRALEDISKEMRQYNTNKLNKQLEETQE